MPESVSRQNRTSSASSPTPVVMPSASTGARVDGWTIAIGAVSQPEARPPEAGYHHSSMLP
jgi:hypothetical protein